MELGECASTAEQSIKSPSKNQFPIPRPDDMLNIMAGATIFSKINLKSSYHQICVRPEDKWKVAFKTKGMVYMDGE